MGVSDAKPGDRFTDLKGRTWVRLAMGYALPWAEYDTEGEYHARSQEDAEAEGLEPLVPAWSEALRSRFAGRPYLTISDLKFEPAPLEQWKRDVLSAAEVCATDEPGPHIVETGGYRLRIDRADYQALLDPADPEDNKRIGAFIQEFNRRNGSEPWALVRASDFYKEAERVRRETAEKAQEDADREKAEEIARAEWTKSHEGFFGDDIPPKWECLSREGREMYTGIALAAIRAERKRQAVSGEG